MMALLSTPLQKENPLFIGHHRAPQKALEAKTKVILQQGTSIIRVHCLQFEEKWREKMVSQIEEAAESAYSLVKQREEALLPTFSDLNQLLEEIRSDLNRIHACPFGDTLTLPSTLPYPASIKQALTEQKMTLFMTGFAEKQYNQLWNQTLQGAIPTAWPAWGKNLLQQGIGSLGIGTLLLQANHCSYDQEKERYRQQLRQRFDGLLYRWRHHLLEQWQQQFQKAVYSWYDEQLALLAQENRQVHAM
ncbi:hypothetical protein [Heliorestis convoluta]|uniref:Uncharacterized protein n=1 Tax=Heliorestis convoluta TaxID=356322 RepID=A0A5Q2N461_9FIRM|nr:hypothetical protein [Heliorestis convoluta]QGG48386.1 hypothetical protein FTV88_2288 [Heliorestis convoluta]